MKIASRVRHFAATLILAGVRAVNAAPVEVAPVCMINEAGVMAHTIVSVRTEEFMLEPPGTISRERWLFRITCAGGSCLGARIALGNIERGEPVQLLDVAIAENMRLDSVKGRVATIVWTRNFSDATITIDLDRKRVDFYSYSSKLGKSVGVGACE
ncbi:MAG TPA: hypothetical protein VJT81_05580 [Burkholderiales bacterium]|nr:hypothetical protein [Burkholderiales bacterium]